MSHQVTVPTKGSTSLLPIAIAGYGLDIALVSIAGWPGAAPTLVPDNAASLFTFTKNLVYCLSFLAVFVITATGSARAHEPLRHPLTYWVPSISFIAGFFIAVGLPIVTVTLPWAVTLGAVVGGALVGAGVAGNFVMWVFVICSQSTPADARCLVGGTAMGGALFFLLAWLPSWVVAAISLIVIAPGTSALLVLCAFRLVPGSVAAADTLNPQSNASPKMARDSNAAQDFSTSQATYATQDVNVFFGGVIRFPAERLQHTKNLRKGVLALIAPYLTISAIGFVMQIVRLDLSIGAPSSDELVGNLNSLALVASSAITWVLFERNHYHLDMSVFYRVAAPGIGLACALLPFLGLGYGYALSFALYTVFSIASVMGILACNQASKHYLISPVAMYALSFAVIYSLRYLPTIPLAALVVGGIGLEGAVPATLPSSLLSVLIMFAAYVFSDRFQTKQDMTRVYSWESELIPTTDEPHRESPQSLLKPIAQTHGLTSREYEVMGMLRSGRSIPAIAEHMDVSPNTVRFHCKNVYAKLGVHSRQELIELINKELHGTSPVG